ncbi:MAG: hypothetical protein EAZ67_11755 [Cytophagales bacterium]|nr:MAG: hypothetical protein EAZ67_11755 [Cytophagales bacterium]
MTVLGRVGVGRIDINDAGELGSVKVFDVLSIPVQPPVVTENPENVPSGKLPKINAPLATIIF